MVRPSPADEGLMAPTTWEEALQRVLARSSGTGVTPAEAIRAQSGLDFLRGILEGRFPRAPIAETLGFDLLEVEAGRAVFQGQPRAEYYNPLGTVHGGWAATLLDAAMACAVHSTLAAGQGYTTLEFKLNLVRPIFAATGPLRAEGKLVNAGRTIATSEGRLFGADGKLYAHGTETCVILAA
jgi:uncharacterized protein (TIGR00369 family)